MCKYFNDDGNEIIGYDVTITAPNRILPFFVEGFTPDEYDYAYGRFKLLYANKNDDDIVELHEVVEEGKGDDREMVSYLIANCD